MGAFFMMQVQGGYRLNGITSKRNADLPVVSVLTVVYNSEEFIERTIQSVLAQTYPNIEHVILDGASKDNTLNIIKKYNDQIAYWKSEKDAGIYDAMNKVQELAQGDYVMFLNSGDEFNDNEVLSNTFKNIINADVYYGDTLETDTQGNPLRHRRLRPPQQLKWTDFRYGMLVCHQSIIIKKELSSAYNINYKIAADIDWAIRSVRNAKQIVNTKITISKFMEGGMSTVHHRRGLEERFKIMTKHFGLFSTLLVHVYMVFRLIIGKIRQ
jgi:glycosyltransferase involved in cell wall biosynthesis